MRKKGLVEDNKDGELARGIDQVVLMPERLRLMSEKVSRYLPSESAWVN